MTSTSRTSIAIRWLPSSDNVGVTVLPALARETLAGTTTGTTYTFSGLACGRIYRLGVEARDAAGNVSGRRSVYVSTSAC